jgi:hypothetical protein
MGVGSLIGVSTSVGFQRAFTWGFIVGIVPLALIWLVGLPILLFYRDRPACICGHCRSQDYRYLSMEQQPLSFDYECPSCSRRYRARDGMFSEVASDGSERPYMRQSTFGRWRLCS